MVHLLVHLLVPKHNIYLCSYVFEEIRLSSRNEHDTLKKYIYIMTLQKSVLTFLQCCNAEKYA